VVVAVLFVVSQIIFLPRLARWIDSRAEPKFAEAAALEAQYCDMTNACRIASEMPPDHPTARLWRDRRTALLAAGFIKTREIAMKQKATSKNWAWNFRTRFAARWPGVECVLRFHESAPPTATVTARRDEFGAIERFLENYWAEQ
jgi:hypothetical protein